MQIGFALSSGLAIRQRLPSHLSVTLHIFFSDRHQLMLATRIEFIERHCFVRDLYDWACSLSVPVEIGGDYRFGR
jgi:hypothetical protein